MPSVRVKGRTYSNLEDVFLESNTPLVDHDGSAQLSPQHLLPRPSLPVLRQDGPNPQPSPSPLIPRRPRSSTTASRIHAHCTFSSRSSQVLNLAQDASPLSPQYLSPVTHPAQLHPHRGETITLDGPQTVVRISSHSEPGLIENSINSITSGDDQDGHPEHHHDDVVEHLDVIGTQHIYSLVLSPLANVYKLSL